LNWEQVARYRGLGAGDWGLGAWGLGLGGMGLGGWGYGVRVYLLNDGW